METKVTTLTHNVAVKPKSAFTQLVERLYAENPQTVGNQGTIASVIGTCFASMSQVNHTWKRETFRDLLLHLEAQGCYAVLREEVYINVLANIAAFGNKLVNRVADWKKDSFVADEQISALIRHCFARYEVPEFMESAFYEENKIHMFWYVQLGRGESVLALSGFPVKLTRKMAHEFKKAPVNYSVGKAIRWAQAKGYGASDDVADSLAWSALAENFENEHFWATVVKFLAKYETLLYADIQEVLFYIHHQFEENKSYAMKGRTWDALLKQANAWNLEYRKKLAALNRTDWNPCGIKGFTKEVVIESQTVSYTVEELLNSEALYSEGYEMSHCVAEYEYECFEGRAAIFSLRKKSAETQETLATIEVSLEMNAVVQAKAKYDEDISTEAEAILAEWAEREKLALEYDDYAVEHHAEGPQAFPQNQDEIDWRIIAFLILMVLKACSALHR